MDVIDSNDCDLDEEFASHHHCLTTSPQPVPLAILKVQLKRLIQQHRERTHQSQQQEVIATKDLLTVIDAYEHEHDVMLLTSDQKTAIQPYTLLDPELEMTPTDILELLKLVFTCPSPESMSSSTLPPPPPPSLTSRLSALPRTSAPLKPNNSRRLSVASSSMHIGSNTIPATIPDIDYGPGPISTSEATDVGDLNHQPTTKSMDEISDDEDDTDNNRDEFVHYYRRSLALTQQLKLSEKSLACMTRDNEDQIAALQNRVDDMTKQVGKQKRELLEYKTKEVKSLEQIGMLEAHIDTIQKSETDQKQVYLSIKTLYDEKCGETRKLQELLRQKELDLQQTETFLNNFHHEFMQLTEERNRLSLLQQDLEKELIASQLTHTQLAEQRSENERLKQVIDTLKYDLDLARHEQLSSGLPNTANLIESLEAELEGQLQLKEDEDAKTLERILQMQQVDERLKYAENEKDYYKSRAIEAIKDLDRVKGELSYLKKTMESENWDLVTELEDLQTKQHVKSSASTGRSLATIDDDFGKSNHTISNTSMPTYNNVTINPSSSSTSSSSCSFTTIHSSSSSVNTVDRFVRFTQPSTDVWSQSRVRGKKLGTGKKREVFDLHNISSIATASHHNQHINKHGNSRFMQSKTILANRQKNDKLITCTTTFAIYTLLVYVFGIVTSTFLIENGPPASWEQALMVTAGQSANGNYKLLDILFYWIEKLLFEGDGMALS